MKTYHESTTRIHFANTFQFWVPGPFYFAFVAIDQTYVTPYRKPGDSTYVWVHPLILNQP